MGRGGLSQKLLLKNVFVLLDNDFRHILFEGKKEPIVIGTISAKI
jgi:hypothetical protein